MSNYKCHLPGAAREYPLAPGYVLSLIIRGLIR